MRLKRRPDLVMGFRKTSIKGNWSGYLEDFDCGVDFLGQETRPSEFSLGSGKASCLIVETKIEKTLQNT